MTFKILENTLRKCVCCGKEFHPITPNQKYCNFWCKKEYISKKRKIFYAMEEVLPRSMITKCLYCGNSLQPYGSQKFCNEDCRRKYRNQKRNKSGRKCDRVIPPKYLKKCEQCGTEIPWNRYYASTYEKKRFCSRKCCAEYFKQHCLDFRGHQRKFGDFKIIVTKQSNNLFIWEAFKDTKRVLRSDRGFFTAERAQQDAKKAFT